MCVCLRKREERKIRWKIERERKRKNGQMREEFMRDRKLREIGRDRGGRKREVRRNIGERER